MSRKFEKWNISTPGEKASKIDAKIRQKAAQLKTIEMIVEFRRPEKRAGWKGLECVEKNG